MAYISSSAGPDDQMMLVKLELLFFVVVVMMVVFNDRKLCYLLCINTLALSDLVMLMLGVQHLSSD